MNMVHGLHLVQQETNVCEACALGIRHIEKFAKKGTWRKSRQLELIQINFCIPMRTPSMGASKHFMAFVNDFSREVLLNFLKYKSKALQMLYSSV
jgi:hypothetical protein